MQRRPLTPRRPAVQRQQEETPPQESQRLDAEPLLLTIEMVAQRLSFSRAKIYEMIQHDHLPVLHFGRSVRVSLKALEAWIEEQEREQQEDRSLMQRPTMTAVPARRSTSTKTGGRYVPDH